MSKLILVDFSGIFYRYVIPHYHKLEREQKDLHGAPLNLEDIYNFGRESIIRVLINYRNKLGKTGNFSNIVLCADSYSWRKDKYDFYKAERSEAKDDSDFDWDSFYAFMDKLLVELKEVFGIGTIKVNGAEGDDIIGTLVHEYNDQFKKIIIISSDHDFKQLFKFKSVKIYDPKINDYIEKVNGFKYLLAHVLMGDRGDGIPNVFTRQDHYVNPIYGDNGKRDRAYGFGEAAFEKLFGDGIDKQTKKQNLKEIKDKHKKRFKQNKTLIDLKFTPKHIKLLIKEQYKFIKLNKNKNKINRKTIMEYLKKYRLRDIRKDIIVGNLKIF